MLLFDISICNCQIIICSQVFWLRKKVIMLAKKSSLSSKTLQHLFIFLCNEWKAKVVSCSLGMFGCAHNHLNIPKLFAHLNIPILFHVSLEFGFLSTSFLPNPR